VLREFDENVRNLDRHNALFGVMRQRSIDPARHVSKAKAVAAGGPTDGRRAYSDTDRKAQ